MISSLINQNQNFNNTNSVTKKKKKKNFLPKILLMCITICPKNPL